MAKIRITFYLTIAFCIFLSENVSTQTLHPNTLDLSPNSQVEDIQYNKLHDKYFVGGSFKQISGVDKPNFLVLDHFLKPLSENPIITINGTIRAIATVENRLYIGGDFSLVNGVSRDGFAVFIMNASGYLLENNHVNLPKGSVVSDLHLTQDGHLIILGDISGTGPFGVIQNLLVLDQTSLKYTSALFDKVQIGTFNPSTLHLYETSDYYVITGDHVRQGMLPEASGMKFNLQGDFAGNIAVPDDSKKQGRSLHQVSDNLFSYSREPGSTSEIVLTDIKTGEIFKRSPDPANAASSCVGNQLPDQYQELYNGNLFYVQDVDAQTTVVERYEVNPNTMVQGSYDFKSVWCSSVVNSQKGNYDSRKMMVANNKLFYFDQRLMGATDSGAGGAGGNGDASSSPGKLLSYCLEPARITIKGPIGPPDPCLYAPMDYTFGDAMVGNHDGLLVRFVAADGSSRTDGVLISRSIGAKPLNGETTGITGAAVNSAEWMPLNEDMIIERQHANGVQLMFTDAFKGGELVLQPYTNCSKIGERILGAALRTTIKRQLYTFTAAADGPANCRDRVLDMTAFTDVQNPKYDWTLPEYGMSWNTNTFSLDLLSEGIPDQEEYVFDLRITYYVQGITECIHRETVIVPGNFQTSTLTLEDDFVEYNCANQTLTIFASSDNAADVVYWRINKQDWLNPAVIDRSVVNPGVYDAVAENAISFCETTKSITIGEDLSKPTDPPVINGVVFSTTNFNVAPLTCATSSMPVTADGNAYYSYYWESTIADKNPVTTFDWSFNTDVVHVVGPNGCEETYTVTIPIDDTPPMVIPMGEQFMNCSTTQLVLDHPQGSNQQNGWEGMSGGDQLTVTYPGYYRYEFINEINGCKEYDKVLVTATKDIDIEFDQTEYVCDGILFSVTALPINISNPHFDWSNGRTAATSYGIGGTDLKLTVTVTDDNGCSGTATALFQVAPEILNTQTVYLGCSNETLLLTNQTTGGIQPYQYSLDGTTYQSSNTFSNLQPGNYNVYIMDAATCLKQFATVITPVTTSPEPDFLVSTNNLPQDLVALVNTTSFGGFDYVEWVLPSGLTMVADFDTVRYVAAADSGDYVVTLTGWIGSCSYSVTKTIHFGSTNIIDFEFDANNGIQSCVLSPNPLQSGTADQLTVDITFGTGQQYALYIWSINGDIIESRTGKGAVVHEVFDLTTHPPGSYVLRVLATYDQAYYPFVKQ